MVSSTSLVVASCDDRFLKWIPLTLQLVMLGSSIALLSKHWWYSYGISWSFENMIIFVLTFQSYPPWGHQQDASHLHVKASWRNMVDFPKPCHTSEVWVRVEAWTAKEIFFEVLFFVNMEHPRLCGQLTKFGNTPLRPHTKIYREPTNFDEVWVDQTVFLKY